MRSRLRPRLTYANVMASVAVFGVLAGGGAVAAGGGGSSDPRAVASASTKKKVKKLTRRVSALEAALAGLQANPAAPAATGVPAAQVAFFNTSACPSGWSELTAAQGRYLVGLNPGGALGGTRGTALTDLQNRAVGQHDHAIDDSGHSHTINLNGGNTDSGAATPFLDLATSEDSSVGEFTQSSTTGITINDAGGTAGTNAPYVQLLVCQKG